MSTPLSSIGMFVLAAAIGAFGQYLYRLGAVQLSFNVRALITNWPLWAGVVCYIAVMVLFLGAYKRGGSLAVLYPVYASTFIFGALLATFTEGYRISSVNLLGMACLVVGMALLGAGQHKGAADAPEGETPKRTATTPVAHQMEQASAPVSHAETVSGRAA